MESQLTIKPKGNSFQFYDFSYNNFNELFKFFETTKNQCRLDEEIPGFTDAVIADNGVAVTFKAILSREIDILEEGRVQFQKYWFVEEGHFAIFKDFMISFGKNAAVKSGVREIVKFTKVEPYPFFITPEKIFEISDQMAFIRTMDFDRMEHPAIKKLHFDGRIETLSDIAPFHIYTSNIKSACGVLPTPCGIRKIKISQNGILKIGKKLEEFLESELFIWIYKNILKGNITTRLDGQMTIDEVAKNE